MNATLNIVDVSGITEADRKEIDSQIDQIISRHKGNRYEINKLVFESVSALTVSENYSNELASQGFLKRLWGGITGENRQLQSKIDCSLAAAQYSSQRTLQKLAEQNLMSFELITAVNNKLNASIIEIETEINHIYGTLVTFFKKMKSDIIQLENRVERLERNVNLLNWQNSIEYQVWNGMEYSELDDISKIVCLTKDFYEITKGKWTTSDLLLLKSAMADIGILPKGYVSYIEFIKTVSTNTQLLEKLFQNISLEGIEQYPQYIALSAGIQKNNLLGKGEKYLVDGSIELLRKYGCEPSESCIKDEILLQYGSYEAQMNLNITVQCYDLILELLYNMEQITEIQYMKTLDEKMQEAKKLFFAYEIEKLIPMLEELIAYGYVEAKYMLALLYKDGCGEIEQDKERFMELLIECVKEQYLPSYIRYVLGLDVADAKDKKMVIDSLNDLEIMAQNDAIASLEYAICCINFNWLGIGDNNYTKAIEYFNNAPLVYRYFSLAKRYDNGEGVEKDSVKSFVLYEKAAVLGYNKAEYEVGKALQGGFGCEKNLKRAFEYYMLSLKHGNLYSYQEVANCYTNGEGVEADDTKAFDFYLKGAEKGMVIPMSNVGWSYENGRGVEKNYLKAIEWFKKADDGYSNRHIGNMYLNGKGVPVDRTMAKEYLIKAKDMGDTEAEKILKDNF